MGEVYKARDTRLEREVAIKVLRAEWSEDPVSKNASSARRRRSPSFSITTSARSTTWAPRTGSTISVMEDLHGETVGDRLNKGPLPIPEVLKIGSQIAEAIEAAHRHRVVHRDLEPGNVILTRAGAKVLDSGLARDAPPPGQRSTPRRRRSSAAITAEGSFTGTMPYMAPEQLEGKAADAGRHLGSALRPLRDGD